MNARFSSGFGVGLPGAGRRTAASARRPYPSGLLVSFVLLVLLCGGQPGKVRAASPEGVAEELELRDGGIVRGPKSAKRLALVFTGHSFAEGGQVILDELARHQAKGSFFFTGDFLANTNFTPLIARLVRDGHYLGPHSDKHLLYCSWDSTPSNLVSRAQFRSDLEQNLRKLEDLGVPRAQMRFFLPPYEHYNRQIAQWSRELGLTLVNFTPGTRANADYTGEAEKNFVASKVIFDSIKAKEQQDPDGLNGVLLLLHIGSGPGRTDKFHARFGELLDYLKGKNYQLVRVDELLRK